MRDPFGDDQNSYWIPFSDFLAGVLSIFLVVAIMLVFHLNDPKHKTQEGEIKSPGSVMVETYWKEDMDVDVWVKSPEDKPVGYSRKQGKFFDLLRDDLGFQYELVAGRHHENVFARNTVAGEYVVNLHMYGTYGRSLPIAVEVSVQIVKHGDSESTKSDIRRVIKTTINLTELGQETTVVRFSLDKEGNLIEDSISHEPMRLRENR